MPANSDSYLNRLPGLMREYDRDVNYTREVLIRYFGEQNLKDLVVETRLEYEQLIPQLPYIGGKEPFTRFIISCGLLLAVYRVAKAHGKTLEESGELVFELGRAYLKAYPAFLTRFLGGMNFSRLYLSRLRRRAAESHLRRYPEDYVYNFVEGDGVSFDYGVDYLECATCKFLARQGATEFAPYLCPVDILYSKALSWGLTRTMTLAQGAEKCDFRFKKGGITQVSVPDSLRAIITREG